MMFTLSIGGFIMYSKPLQAVHGIALFFCCPVVVQAELSTMSLQPRQKVF
jgi:hypothetical protein